MAVFNPEDISKLYNNLEEYLDLYGQFYPEGAVDFIKKHFLSSHFFLEDIDIMCQVYQLTGTYEMFPCNPYLNYLREMKKTFDIDRDLLEVGSGFYPAMAKIISDIQVKGSITAMDYDSVISELGKIRILKEHFTVDTDVSKYEMIFGVMPCEGTIPMIYSANKNDKDLFIGLCGCTHFENPESIPFITSQTWFDYVESIVKKTLPKDRKYEMYTTSDINYPLIKIFK